ncbi:MAG: DUF2306 domain-containing protein [Rhodobacteraceae bacterium]|nr:DUF2306 domain-containing protein [Paracoccaceae bacterium]MBR9822603.1 DUF2306 domain-containing protein [Paracoccaceae bacterium]
MSLSTTPTPRPNTWKRLRSGILWVLCIAIALLSLRFLVFGIAESMDVMLEHSQLRPFATYTHILLAPLVLTLLPFQFWSGLRTRRPALHRGIGRSYALGILLSGTAGLWLAVTTPAGPVAGWGFGLLAVLWLGVTAQAVRFARRREITRHRRWMIRSAALTLAAVSLRLQLPFLAYGLGFDLGYTLVAWSCWVPNVVVAELLLLRPILQRA